MLLKLNLFIIQVRKSSENNTVGEVLANILTCLLNFNLFALCHEVSSLDSCTVEDIRQLESCMLSIGVQIGSAIFIWNNNSIYVDFATQITKQDIITIMM